MPDLGGVPGPTGPVVWLDTDQLRLLRQTSGHFAVVQAVGASARPLLGEECNLPEILEISPGSCDRFGREAYSQLALGPGSP